MSSRNNTEAAEAAPMPLPEMPAATSAEGDWEGANELPARFEFRLRGASVVVVDKQTDRQAAFPKSATGVVSRVLGGLFSEEKVAAGRKDWKGKLPKIWRKKALGLTLTKGKVAVNPAHPNVILGAPSDFPEGHVIPAYSIDVNGEHMGYVLAHAETKFVLIVDDKLQNRATQHRGFSPATLRLEVLVGGLVATAVKAVA